MPGEKLRMPGEKLNFDQHDLIEDGKGSQKEIFSSKYQYDHQFNMDYGGLETVYFNVVPPPLPAPNNVGEPEIEKKERPYAASLEILSNYKCRLRRFNVEKIKIQHFEVKRRSENVVATKKLSTGEILKLAAEKFIQMHSSKVGVFQNASSEEDNRDVGLVVHLLHAAEKVGQKDYDRAKKLLKKCSKFSSDNGSPVQRLVHCFCGSLLERVERESGRFFSAKGVGIELSDSVQKSFSTISSTILAFQKNVPFCYVSQFAGIQAIIEQVEGARKIHVIDLQIKLGLQYTALIQALAARFESDCPVELLKITAVTTKSKQEVESTGIRLSNFAESFNLPFSFNVVVIEDITDLRESLFDLPQDESLAVYCDYFLMLILHKPEKLQYLMEIIKSMNPCVMVLTEVEANHNSPVFANRFTEALFYYGAFFDAFEECLKGDDASRADIETMFRQGIKNVVGDEEEERSIRHVKIRVWRAFFARFGMFEVELSMSSVYQANLLLRNFACGSSLTLEMDGKSLIVGWKGTPTNSLSAWIFV